METSLFKIKLAVTRSTPHEEETRAEECEFVFRNNRKCIVVPLDEMEVTEQKLKSGEVGLLISNLLPAGLTEINAEKLKGIDFIVMQDGDKQVKIVFNDILFLKANEGMVDIFKTNGLPEISSITLDEFERRLPPGLFFRAHHGYIVHRKYIVKSIYYRRGGILILSEGTRLDISFSKTPDFKKWYN